MKRYTLLWILLFVTGILTTPFVSAAVYPSHKSQDKVSSGSLRFLVLRAEFVPDTLATTTGTGEFDLSNSSDYNIDAPPHNRTYFQHQMLALKKYFARISNNNVVINADVYPVEENGSYKLSENMVYYSGQEDEERQNLRWSEMLRDVINLAIEQDNPDFSLYDGVVLFHAGVGNDFAFDLDYSPYDIQSVYLDLETLQNTLGEGNSAYPGIDVGNGNYVKEGIILPEMQNQEEYDLGLLGTMTLLMGSKLGMPSMFNTETGDAGVGQWGLMDQGSYNFQGLIPAYPCAWMKVYMGWEEPVTVTQGENLKIGSVNTVTAPHIFKIPISATEYYLIENRQSDPNNDHYTFGRDEYGNRAQFDTLGNVVADSDIKVLTSVDEYDFGLPGSGLLIWHIDESVIQQNIASNTINNNRDHRGVDLIECDGAQDIGYYYDMFSAASGAESGDYYDPYWAGNESHMYVNNETDTVALSPNTIPNSNSWDGSVTHLNIYNISANDTIMTFSVRNDRLLPGFPKDLGSGFFSGSLKDVVIDYQSNPENPFYVPVALSVDGKLWGRTIPATTTTLMPDDPVMFDLLLSVDGQFELPPAAADLNRDAQADELVLLSKTGILYIASWNGATYDLAKSIDLDVTPSAGPMIVQDDQDFYIVLGTQDGNVLSIAFDDQLETTQYEYDMSDQTITSLATVYPAKSVIFVSDINGHDVFIDARLLSPVEITRDAGLVDDLVPDGSAIYQAIVYYADDSGTAIWETSASGMVNRIGSPAPESQAIAGPPALGDIDGDGIADLVMQHDNMLYGYNTNHVSTTNFPIELTENAPAAQLASPLVVDTDEFGTLVINASGDGKITVHDKNGDLLQGYPLTAGTGSYVTPLLFKWDHADPQENYKCAVISTDGYLFVWDMLFSQIEQNSWSQYGSDKYNRFVYVDQDRQYVPNESELLPSKSVYCYPNPSYGSDTFIRYRINSNVSKVSVKIYDVAGDLVSELNGNGTTPGDHEICWNHANIESGAYIARVQVSNGAETAVEFIKIAVVK